MAYVGDTGQGATLTLDVTGAVGCVRSMQLPSWNMQTVDASCLDTTGFRRVVPGDLTDAGQIVVEAVFDASLEIPIGGVVESITVTFPIGVPTNTSPATLVGSGFITNRVLPSMAINELMTLTLTLNFNGDVGPTYTPEAA